MLSIKCISRSRFNKTYDKFTQNEKRITKKMPELSQEDKRNKNENKYMQFCRRIYQQIGSSNNYSYYSMS